MRGISFQIIIHPRIIFYFFLLKGKSLINSEYYVTVFEHGYNIISVPDKSLKIASTVLMKNKRVGTTLIQ